LDRRPFFFPTKPPTIMIVKITEDCLIAGEHTPAGTIIVLDLEKQHALASELASSGRAVFMKSVEPTDDSPEAQEIADATDPIEIPTHEAGVTYPLKGRGRPSKK
jgi:hypothetical protein